MPLEFACCSLGGCSDVIWRGHIRDGMYWSYLMNKEKINKKNTTELMKIFLYLSSFLLYLYNFHEDDGAIFIPQSQRLGNKNSSQLMNIHCSTILGMLILYKNMNMTRKELEFLNERSPIIFTLLLSRGEESIHMIPFGRRSGPLVGHGQHLENPFNPWPRLMNDQSRVPMMNIGASSFIHVIMSHSVID